MDHRKTKAIDLRIQGKTNKEIAKLLGVTPKTITQWSKDEEFKAEENKRRDDVIRMASKKLEERLDNCIDNIYEIAMSAKSETVRLNASIYYVDRVMGKIGTKPEQTDNKADNKQDTTIDLDKLAEQVQTLKVV